MERQYRHGDVFLRQVESLPGSVRKQRRNGDVVLAEGELTGHAHRIKDRGVALYTEGERRFVEVSRAGAALTHEEHARIDLAPGVYEVFIQRVYDEEQGWVRVLD